jgi:hypothetical protein
MKTMTAGIIHRHDAQKYALARSLESLHCLTTVEPTNLTADVMDPEGLRPDIRADLTDHSCKSILLDVTNVNTTNKTNLTKVKADQSNVRRQFTKTITNNDFMDEQGTIEVTIKQSAAINEVENKKIKKYSKLASKNHMNFEPIVISTRGNIGYQTKHFMKRLSYLPEAVTNPSFKSHCLNTLMIALIKGNARIASKAITRFSARHGEYIFNQHFYSSDESDSDSNSSSDGSIESGCTTEVDEAEA